MVKFYKKTTMAQQIYSVKIKYNNVIEYFNYNRHIEKFICVMNLQPSPESGIYKVRVEYQKGLFPRVWLIEPELEMVDGKRAHHVYWGKEDKDGHPQLCVFYNAEDNWNSNRLVGDVFIPWVISWLYTYEYWLLTGEWHYSESGHSNVEKQEPNQ